VGLITEHDGVIDGYEAVELPDPVVTEALTASIFRRRSAMPSRRAVLYLHCLSDSFVPEDVACWYTARGFNFYVADLRPPDRKDGTAGSTRRGRKRQGGKALRASFAELDAATAYLRDVDGVDSLIVSAHAAGAVTAALWCDERRDKKPADALILASPAFGRRRRRPFEIPCPALIVSGPGGPGDPCGNGAAGHAFPWRARGKSAGLGPHVTFLNLAENTADDTRPTNENRRTASDRRRFFEEMGRWLGAYMYGQVRDQLL
jgi:alpha-beta hydrolase superfamily lysophospholipase